MAGNYRYTAVLDACVLYPAPLRYIFLSLASAMFFMLAGVDVSDRKSFKVLRR